MKLSDAKAKAESFKDGCTRHVNCVNVRDVLIKGAVPDFVVSDWMGEETVYSYTNGREH